MKLIAQLESVRARGYDKVFRNRDNASARGVSDLLKIAKARYSQENDLVAIEKTLSDAVESLPQALIPKVSPPKSADMPLMTYRRAAQILFQAPNFLGATK